MLFASVCSSVCLFVCLLFDHKYTCIHAHSALRRNRVALNGQSHLLLHLLVHSERRHEAGHQSRHHLVAISHRSLQPQILHQSAQVAATMMRCAASNSAVDVVLTIYAPAARNRRLSHHRVQSAACSITISTLGNPLACLHLSLRTIHLRNLNMSPMLLPKWTLSLRTIHLRNRIMMLLPKCTLHALGPPPPPQLLGKRMGREAREGLKLDRRHRRLLVETALPRTRRGSQGMLSMQQMVFASIAPTTCKR